MKNLTVLIPTLNEEENIGDLIDAILSYLAEVNITVVDDGSQDKTQEIIRGKMEENDNIQLIDRTESKVHGLSISIEEGIKTCKTKYFMVIDGDMQHPPEYLVDALECMRKDPDIVIAYRIEVENWPFIRKLISWGAQVLGQTVLFLRRKQRPKDIMSGFFGGNTQQIKDLLEEANIEHKGYKILFDILKVMPREYDIEQFGYIFKNRERGDSKIGRKQILAFFFSIFK